MNNESQNIFMKKLRESPGMRFCVLFGCFFIFLILTSLVLQAINVLPGTERDHLLWASIVQNVLVFCLPAYFLAKFCSNHPFKWLKLSIKSNLRPFLGILIVYMITMPAMDWLTSWNSNLTFPEFLSGLERVLRGWEEAGSDAGETLVESSGFFSLLAGVLVVGVLTGFSEEIFFRGGVQGILSRAGMSVGAAVWIAATLFSALHFQFFGFLPRLLMGAFFGYLLVWTNDIKTSVFAHILNNSMVMIFGAIYGSEILSDTELGIFPDIPYLPLISFLVTIAFFIFCRSYFFKNSKTFSIPWQKRAVHPPFES